MIRSAMVLCAGIIVAACFACMPAPPPGAQIVGAPGAQHAGGPVAPATCQNDNSSFLSHVKFIPAGYDPSSNPANPPPSTIVTGPIDSYAAQLQNAYLLAPPAFQKTLCSLSGIYVNGPTTCSSLSSCSANSWGYRASNGQTFIAISAGLWSLTCPGHLSPYNFNCFESDLFDSVLGWDPSDSQAPRHGAANTGAGRISP